MATAEEQADRNRQVYLERAEGRRVNDIASKHGLTPARVRQILASGVRVLAEDRDDPVQLALELRAEFELVLEQAKTIAGAIPMTNAAAKTGALKLVLQALERLTEWHRYVGVLPAQLVQEIDARAVAAELMRLFDLHQIEDHVKDEFLEALELSPGGHSVAALP